MKFDLCVMNPPFGNDHTTKGIGTKKLYQAFVKKALVYSDYVLAITPTGWFSPSRKTSNFLQNCRSNFQFEFIIFNDIVKKQFKEIGSSFCYFMIKNHPIKYITRINDFEVDLRTLPFLPIKINKESISITRKLLLRSKFKVITGGSEQHSSGFNRDSNVVKIQDSEHPYPVFNTNKQILYAIKPHTYQFSKKVIWSISGNVKPFFDDGYLGLNTD